MKITVPVINKSFGPELDDGLVTVVIALGGAVIIGLALLYLFKK